MRLTWLKQDPAVRSLPYWLLIGPLSTIFILGVSAWSAATAAKNAHGAPGSWTISSFTVWASFFWCAAVPLFFAPGSRQRCSRLAMSLPVSSRKLWLTHLLAVIFSGAAIFIVAWGLVALNSALLVYAFQGPNLFQPDLPRLAIHLGIGLILAAVLLQSPKPQLRQIPLSQGYVFFLALTLLGVLGLVILLGSLPLAFVLIPLSVAAATGFATYRSLPAAFSLVSRQAEEEANGGTLREEPSRSRQGIASGWLLHRTLWRNLYGKWLLWLWLALACIASLGILLSGITWTEGRDLYYLRLTLVPITVYMLLALLAMPLRNLFRIDPLPISRRHLFAASTLPFLAILSLGYAAGAIGEALAQPPELISYRKEPDSHHYLFVPIEACEVAWNGRVPENASPWGESHAAWSEPIYRGSRARFYSPYHTPRKSSLDFVALQISRATQAVYGQWVPPEEIRKRYLEVDAEGHVGLKERALSLQADYPHLRPRIRGHSFPVVLSLVGFSWMMVLSVYFRAFRAEVSERARKLVFFGLLFLLLAAHIGQYVIFFNRFTEPYKITGILEILIRPWSNSLPGVIAIWGFSVALLYAGHRFGESRFMRIEVPAKPDKLPVWEAFAEV